MVMRWLLEYRTLYPAQAIGRVRELAGSCPASSALLRRAGVGRAAERGTMWSTLAAQPDKYASAATAWQILFFFVIYSDLL
jgi:hypothetical protein